MFLKDISPFVRQAIIGSISNKIHNPGVFKRLKAPFHRLFYIIDGSGTITVNSVEHNFKPGSAIIIRSGMEYFWNTENAQIIAVNFDYTSNFSDFVLSNQPARSENFSINSQLSSLSNS